MNLRTQRREDPEVSLTPLIDIVFLLLIFFMVSTTFDKHSEFDIQLPTASQAPTDSQPIEQVEIAIDASGRYAVNDQLLPDSELATLMAALSTATGGKILPVLINADGQAAHQAVIKAMDAAGQLGLSRLGIVTLHDDPSTATQAE